MSDEAKKKIVGLSGRPGVAMGLQGIDSLPLDLLQDIDFSLPETELRIVGLEVTPRSIAGSNATNPFAVLSKIGPAFVVAGEPIYFSYNVTIEHSNDDWPTRLDHFLNFGSNKLKWEQLVAAFTVLIVAATLFSLVLCSALSKDNDMIRYLRSSYRQSRFNTARSKFLRTGPGYAPVGQEGR